jgi:hypothetical protein
MEVLVWKLFNIRVVLFYSKLLKDFFSESLRYEKLTWLLISAPALHLPTAGHWYTVVGNCCFTLLMFKETVTRDVTFHKIAVRVIWIRCSDVKQSLSKRPGFCRCYFLFTVRASQPILLHCSEHEGGRRNSTFIDLLQWRLAYR